MTGRHSKAEPATIAALATVLAALALTVEPACARDDAPDAARDGVADGLRPNERETQFLGRDGDAGPLPPMPPAEVLYNLGVARFRAGDLTDAERLFRAAAERGRSEVAARAMFNEGTTAYAEVLRALSPEAPEKAQGGDPEAMTGAAQEDPLAQAIARLESGLRILKDAIRADPANDDARANAEFAQRLLRQLRQQQQNQQQQSQDQQNQDQQNQDQQNQDQQNQDQQNQDQQNQDQQNQDQQNRDQQNQDQQNQDQEGQDQQQQPQPQEGQEKDDSTAESKPRPTQAQERKPMTREEIERLLQRVRAKEAARIEKQMQEERARRKPAPKDW